MPVLTRKRKAELESAEKEVQRQLLLEAEHATEEHPSKRQKRDDPFKRTDPFRPISPPPKTVLRRRGQVKYSTLKKRPTKSQQLLPMVFFTVPEANPARQVSAKSRSSNDVDTILATKSLVDHVDKYGVEAMPSREALESWLEEHKDEFIQARAERTRQQPTPIRRTQAAPHAPGHTGPESESSAARHPAVRPSINQPGVTIGNGGIFRRAVRHARRTAESLLSRAIAVLEETIPEEQVLVTLIYQEPQAPREPQEPQNHASVGAALVRPIAPPLDPRFFHPNGQLHSVYKYLTAQIPLPQQWVRWAIHNDIPNVPGRGDIREAGTYVAEDTFDYDALYQAIHRGHFKTGRIEIDYYLDHWPGVEGRRDDMIADLELHEFRITLDEQQPNDRLLEKSGAPSPEPPPPSESAHRPGSEFPVSRSTYSLPDHFSDTTGYATSQATISDFGDEDS
ncbi:hypothetical protein F4781DRAFT_336608 [Annulohypoxylon bovei var. microspora]|nr:hypothetical protein F4781DRAFT_336608 [Annulohypoxylon bovei var. microspora]